MCIAPLNLDPNTTVSCRRCWQCLQNRLNDLTGRCVAEAETSDQAFSITLTYAGDTPKAVVFCYRDVQLFMKRLREAGYNARYIVAGEYGGKNGRVHWHLVLFLKGKLLEIVDYDNRTDDWQVVLPRFSRDPKARIQWTPWSNDDENRGFVYVQQPDYGGFRYALKYALKDQKDKASARRLGMSKKPPLGHDYFMRRADDHVEAKLPIQRPTYSYMDIRDKKGKPLEFCLQGRMRELYLDRYRTMWRLNYGEAEPMSPWYQDKYDLKIEQAQPLSDEDFMSGFLAYRAHQKWVGQRKAKAEAKRIAELQRDLPEWTPKNAYSHAFMHKGRQCFIDINGKGLTIDLNDGGPLWRVGRTDEKTLGQQLLATGLNKTALSQLVEWIMWAWPHMDALLLYFQRQNRPDLVAKYSNWRDEPPSTP